MNRLIAIFSVIFGFINVQCNCNFDEKHLNFKFDTLFTSSSKFNYMYVGNIDSTLIATLSNSQLYNMYSRVLNISTVKHASEVQEKYQTQNDFIISTDIDGESILLVIYDFKKNTLSNRMMLSNNGGETWSEINCPIPIIRKAIKLGFCILADGDMNGSPAIYCSYNFGKSWFEITGLTDGYKSIQLLTVKTKNEVLCLGEHGFNKDSYIVIMNPETKSFRDIAKIEDKFNFIEVIGKGNLIGLYKDGKLSLYQNKESLGISTVCCSYPKDIKYIDNIYFDSTKLIITGISENQDQFHLSWISTDKGKTWSPFFHDEQYELVYNTLEHVIVKDKYNNVGELVNN